MPQKITFIVLGSFFATSIIIFLLFSKTPVITALDNWSIEFVHRNARTHLKDNKLNCTTINEPELWIPLPNAERKKFEEIINEYNLYSEVPTKSKVGFSFGFTVHATMVDLELERRAQNLFLEYEGKKKQIHLADYPQNSNIDKFIAEFNEASYKICDEYYEESSYNYSLRYSIITFKNPSPHFGTVMAHWQDYANEYDKESNHTINTTYRTSHYDHQTVSLVELLDFPRKKQEVIPMMMCGKLKTGESNCQALGLDRTSNTVSPLCANECSYTLHFDISKSLLDDGYRVLKRKNTMFLFVSEDKEKSGNDSWQKVYKVDGGLNWVGDHFVEITPEDYLKIVSE